MTQNHDGRMTRFAAADLALRDDPSSHARFWEIALERVRLTYYDVAPAAVFPLHRHDGEQITYVLEGELIFGDGRQAIPVLAGEAITVPARVAHSVTGGPQGARAIDAWSYPIQTEML